ncbi:MAG: hypothetical protein NWR72_18360 [Bacteroidia bacterium]|nr:hypothetical protein [Bacteroidia bacterium]
MKPILIPFFILILTAPLLQAQNHTTGAREQVEAFRVAYYTRELNLSSEEAQRFWPVYNEFSDALEENRVAERQTQMALRQAYVGGSDQEVEKLLSKLMELKREEVDLTIRYHESFKAVLPIRKVAMLYKAETDFKRKLLEHLQERRQERLNGRP